MATSKEVKEGYASTLQDLTFNSKPLINVLTMLADENAAHAKDIVDVIETYLTKVRIEVKLPVLYLIDCIIKNVNGPYTALFCQNIVSTFCTVFEKVDEKTRAEMFKLRQTWNDIIPSKKLYALDVQIHTIDPAWPVTAPPPANSIHFNPKFLKNTTATAAPRKDLATKIVTPVNLLASQTPLDPATLDMQKKLLMKKQELLELQQKKIELELLQTQVKLQEQLKSKVLTDQPAVEPKNMLLKPEVAKQLDEITQPSVTNNAKNKLFSMGAAAKQKLQNSSNPTARITPVSSSLLAARPIKDPRLLRQQASAVNSNSTFENKPVPPPPVDSKVIVNSNKTSVRDVRNEPRLVTNKDIPISQGKARALPRIPIKSNTKNTDSHKIPKSSRSSKSSLFDGPSKSSASLLDPPAKKGDKSSDSSKSRSPSKSPNKHKKKDSVSKSDVKRSDKSKQPKPERDSKSSKSDNAAFKDLKSQVKNRNYIRRNHASSMSPEPNRDVDLRLGVPPEKIPRLQGESDKNLSNDEGMDIDLRHLPDLGKKRTSTEATEPSSSKKKKTAVFEELFGNEDTDLRQLNVMLSPKKPEKPSTPPPPIISDKLNISDEVKERNVSKTELDLVRAKLSKFSKSITADAEKKPPSAPSGDVDFRKKFRPDDNYNSKIIISPDDEQCIKTGNMTSEQGQALISKIIAQVETQKLLEAKRKEKTETEKHQTHQDRHTTQQEKHMTLQPISDEELDYDASDPEEDLKKARVLPPMASGLGDFKFQRGGPMGMRGRGPWRDRRGRLIRPPMRPRAGIEPWVRPMGPMGPMPWRPIGPPFKPPMDNFIPNDLDDQGGNSPNTDGSQDTPNIILNCSNKDNIKSINIDGIPRDIRYYDEVALAFMSWDDPREISFHNGSRRVHIDDELFILNFNEPYKEVMIKGNPHRIRLGAPTREIYLDGKWYECYFGGPSIPVELDGKIAVIKMEGPPPQVKIGTTSRTDLVAGKINLIIDAKNVVPIFLDGKVQNFEIDGQTHTLQFVDALRTVLINDAPYKVEFGGLPKPITVNEKKHFIRFSVLPKGVKPGYVNIKDMKGSRIPSPMDEGSLDGQPIEANTDSQPALPALFKARNLQPGAVSPDANSNSAFQFNNFLQQPNLNQLDVLSTVMTSSLAPTPNTSGYSIANVPQTESGNSQDANLPPVTNPLPVLPPSLNINELFQKLVATGIVTSSTAKEVPLKQPPPKQREPKPQQQKPVFNARNIKPVYFDRLDTLKQRQQALIQSLHVGMQCSSCGMRFPPENSMHYSQHLDWHFRQNRKGKKNIRKAASRRWYYSLSDWKNYEEVEDIEEREKNYFDQQQAQGEGAADEVDEEIEIPSVIADPNVVDAHCEVCQDKFEQFYNEEKEEWHLRMAIRVDDKTYHPLCYEDYQQSLSQAEESSENGIPGLEPPAEEEETTDKNGEIEAEIVIDEDDDEVKETDKPEESPAAIEEKPTVEEEAAPKEDEEDDDDDVIIHEVIPERIILDDDDGKDEEYVPQNIPKREIVIKEEPIDDGFMDVEGGVLKLGNIKIKEEPIDLDESALSSTLEEIVPSTDNTHHEMVTLIDGNVEFESGMAPPSSGISGKIKINITKPLPVITTKENKDLVSSEIDSTSPELIDPSQPLPPGEEPVQLNVKPALQGLTLKKLPPVQKGSELTGLCSIM